MGCTIGAISDFCFLEAGVGAYDFVLATKGVRATGYGLGWSAQGLGIFFNCLRNRPFQSLTTCCGVDCNRLQHVLIPKP